MAKNVKAKDHENLTDSNIAKVIGLLEGSSPISKKDACEILNINYNTTRLNNIIEGYKSRKLVEKKQKAAKKGKPASEDEIKEIVDSYLKGEGIATIAKSIYRSNSFIKGVIDKIGVPQKISREERKEPAYLPDSCVSETFEVGQKVWSAKYHAPCEIIAEIDNTSSVDYEDRYSCKCFKIYVFEHLTELPEYISPDKVGGYYAYSTAYDLGSLNHLFKYGVKMNV